jgi:hypothetical protein
MPEPPRCACGRPLVALNRYGAVVTSPWPACPGCGLRADACACPPAEAADA